MSAERLCPHCGQLHREGARFCNATGRLIDPQKVDLHSNEIPTGQTGKLKPQTTLNNRYVVIDKIGQGGMAAVYKATDKWQPGSVWAVKEMSDKTLTDPEERKWGIKAFRQEAELLRTLNHPNLPKVTDHFTQGSKHYLVMELIEGDTLESLLNTRQAPYSESEVLPWALQLCDVLGYLHSQRPKIIFRDLKPGNIMLKWNGQLKLIDFGIVRFFKPGKTQDTMALGTPGYTAPEAISGQTDEQSDIYSLCVTLHQLLTRHNPVKSLFNVPPAREINPSVSPQTEEIIKRGTETQREYRWTNVYELRNALQSLPRSQEATAVSNQGAQHNIINPFGNSAVASAAEAGSLSKKRAIPEPSSRPTTRLIAAAAELSPLQLALMIGIIIIVLVGTTALLAQPLDEMDFDWNNIPIIALFGAFGYAAFPKRGSVFVSHTLFTSIIAATLYIVLGDQQYSFLEFGVAVVVSGIVMEIWVTFLPKTKNFLNTETWIRELTWLALMEIIGVAIFYSILKGWESGLSPIKWGVCALFGGIGWFLGDLIQQFFQYRSTGLRRIR